MCVMVYVLKTHFIKHTCIIWLTYPFYLACFIHDDTKFVPSLSRVSTIVKIVVGTHT